MHSRLRKLLIAATAVFSVAAATIAVPTSADARWVGGWRGAGWHGGYGGWRGVGWRGGGWGLAGLLGVGTGAAIASSYYGSGYYNDPYSSGYGAYASGYGYPYGHRAAYCRPYATGYGYRQACYGGGYHPYRRAALYGYHRAYHRPVYHRYAYRYR